MVEQEKTKSNTNKFTGKTKEIYEILKGMPTSRARVILNNLEGRLDGLSTVN